MDQMDGQRQDEQTSKRYIQLSDSDAIAMLRTARCPHCEQPKSVGSALCRTDYLALPLYLRNWVSRGLSADNFVEGLRRALQHLADLGPGRQVRVLEDGSGWCYRTADDLEQAGFEFREITRCRVPGCHRQIAWYRRPDGRMLAVNVPECQPHSSTCRDPQYFARRRGLQTSAKRKRRTA